MSQVKKCIHTTECSDKMQQKIIWLHCTSFDARCVLSTYVYCTSVLLLGYSVSVFCERALSHIHKILKKEPKYELTQLILMWLRRIWPGTRRYIIELCEVSGQILLHYSRLSEFLDKSTLFGLFCGRTWVWPFNKVHRMAFSSNSVQNRTGVWMSLN